MDRPTETDEWVTARVDTWVETYKKSMLAPAVLSIVSHHGPLQITELATAIVKSTNWQLTERGLYRTIKRLQDDGMLASRAVDAPRTGAKRKLISITPSGSAYLAGVTRNLVRLEDRAQSPHD